MKLLDIQEEKVRNIVNLLSQDKFNKDRPLYFQSPTGSGKTLMLARIIEDFKEKNSDNKFLFLVASISTGGIEKQNYDSLKWSIENGCNFKIEHIPSGLTQPIRPQYYTDVLTIGEASFKNKSNLFKNHLLEEFLSKKNETHKIIFIRDEAHIGTKTSSKESTQNLSRLKNYFYKQLYLSATIEDEKRQIILDEEMTLSEAQSSGLIKNNISLFNGDLKREENEEHLFELACKTLISLWGTEEKPGLYRKISDIKKQIIKPAMLVQVSSKTKGEEEITQIINICKKYKLNYAYALSNKKEAFMSFGSLKNKEISRQELQSNDSDIDVIIFKFAIATGWNIPRACVLSQYRNIASDNLRIQTLGRVLRNIFVGDEINFNKLTDEEKQQTLTCYLYSAHQSAKQYETSILRLKDRFEYETVKKTSFTQTSKDDQGIGYVKKYKNWMVNDYIRLFEKEFKDKDINGLLNTNGCLEIKISKTLFIGNTSINEISNQSLVENLDLSKKTIVWVDKIISNKFQLEKEFSKWIERNTPFIKPVMTELFLKLKYNEQIMFKCKVLKDIEFSKKIIAIKRSYQTKSEKDKMQTVYDLKISEIKLPRIQLSNNPKENVLLKEIRHLKNLLTTTINGEDKLFYQGWHNSSIKYTNPPEKAFLEDLDAYVEEEPDFLKFIHRNEKGLESITYSYYDEEEQKHNSYPDYILRTAHNTTIVCEIKTLNGSNSYEERSGNIEEGYKHNSEKISEYFFGLVKHGNKYQLHYYKEGKKVPLDFLELNNFKSGFYDLCELKVLFDMIKYFEKNNIVQKNVCNNS